MNSGIAVPANLYPGTIKHGLVGMAMPGQGSSHPSFSIVCVLFYQEG